MFEYDEHNTAKASVIAFILGMALGASLFVIVMYLL